LQSCNSNQFFGRIGGQI